MKGEPTDKFLRVNRHDLLPIAMLIILVRIPAMLTPSFRMKLTPIFRQADPLKRREPGEGDSDKLTPSDLIQYSGMLTPKGLFLGD